MTTIETLKAELAVARSWCDRLSDALLGARVNDAQLSELEEFSAWWDATEANPTLTRDEYEAALAAENRKNMEGAAL
jgi:hypothetical protein